MDTFINSDGDPTQLVSTPLPLRHGSIVIITSWVLLSLLFGSPVFLVRRHSRASTITVVRFFVLSFSHRFLVRPVLAGSVCWTSAAIPVVKFSELWVRFCIWELAVCWYGWVLFVARSSTCTPRARTDRRRRPPHDLLRMEAAPTPAAGAASD
ncbi:hypothetical protein DFP72DRAFT_501667 [Ephemerocybe angulata]|uniref:Uncharacterized protein n=1 Tax=Ephemerocybe angulata TaxID=980116 RepID=A0A8H6M1H1_9AGAR|nr:hypothetical protein DFP72DRAFT_501667 [Tulosesus angulatus]